MAIVVVAFGCKKYDEGPGLSLKTKMSRITGEWTIKSWTSNGIDMLNYYADYGNITCDGDLLSVIYRNEYITSKETWTFDKNGDVTVNSINKDKTLNFSLSYSLCDDYYDEETNIYNYKGKWKFSSNKESIEVVFDDSPADIYNYDIKMLKSDEMKFEGLMDGELVKFTFNK